jgi:hypothetical protein
MRKIIALVIGMMFLSLISLVACTHQSDLERRKELGKKLETQLSKFGVAVKVGGSGNTEMDIFWSSFNQTSVNDVCKGTVWEQLRQEGFGEVFVINSAGETLDACS